MMTSLWNFSVWPLCPMMDLRDPTVPGIPASSLQLKTPVSAEGPACSVVSQMRESLSASLSPPPPPAAAVLPLYARTLDDSPHRAFTSFFLQRLLTSCSCREARGLKAGGAAMGPAGGSLPDTGLRPTLSKWPVIYTGWHTGRWA